MRHMTRRSLIGAGWSAFVAVMLPWGAARAARAAALRPSSDIVVVNGWVLRSDDGIVVADDR